MNRTFIYFTSVFASVFMANRFINMNSDKYIKEVTNFKQMEYERHMRFMGTAVKNGHIHDITICKYCVDHKSTMPQFTIL